MDPDQHPQRRSDLRRGRHRFSQAFDDAYSTGVLRRREHSRPFGVSSDPYAPACRRSFPTYGQCPYLRAGEGRARGVGCPETRSDRADVRELDYDPPGISMRRYVTEAEFHQRGD